MPAATPKPWRRPFGEACGPSSRAACMTAWTARQPVMRDQGQRRSPRPFAALGLPLADAVHQVEGVEQGRGHRHGAVDAALPLLQALDHQHAGGEVDAIGGERQRLGEAAAGVGEGHAQGAGVTVGALCGAEEGIALAGGKVFARAVRRMQLHPGGGEGIWPGTRRHAGRCGPCRRARTI
jgi:hypothetical protein